MKVFTTVAPLLRGNNLKGACNSPLSSPVRNSSSFLDFKYMGGEPANFSSNPSSIQSRYIYISIAPPLVLALPLVDKCLLASNSYL